MVLVVRNLLANAGDAGVTGSIPGLGRSPGEGNGNPLQYSWLENSMDRGIWQATLHGFTKSRRQLNTYPHTHTETHTHTLCYMVGLYRVFILYVLLSNISIFMGLYFWVMHNEIQSTR